MMTILLIVVFSIYLVSVWRPDWFNPGMNKMVVSTAVIILFVRFSVPLVAIGSEGMYAYFLHDQYVESSAQLAKTQREISKISSDDETLYGTTDDDSVLGMAKRFLDSPSITKAIGDRIEQYKQLAADATEHAINLIVVFVIQTIAFPLLFLWLLYRGAKAVWAGLVLS
jgi:hypothetical protein